MRIADINPNLAWKLKIDLRWAAKLFWARIFIGSVFILCATGCADIASPTPTLDRSPTHTPQPPRPTPTATPLPPMQEYVSGGFFFSIPYPMDWSVQDLPNGVILSAQTLSPTGEVELNGPVLAILSQPLDGAMNAAEALRAWIEITGEGTLAPGYSVGDLTDVASTFFTKEDPNSGLKTSHYHTSVVYQEQLYLFLVAAPQNEWRSAWELIRYMLDHFQFLDEQEVEWPSNLALTDDGGEWLQYISVPLGIALPYPSDWSIEQGPQRVIFREPASDSEETHSKSTEVTFLVDPGTGNDFPGNMTAQIMDHVQNIQTQTIHFERASRVRLGTLPGWYIPFRITGDHQSEMRGAAIGASTTKAGYAALITTDSDRWEEHWPIWAHMLSELALTSPETAIIPTPGTPVRGNLQIINHAAYPISSSEGDQILLYGEVHNTTQQPVHEILITGYLYGENVQPLSKQACKLLDVLAPDTTLPFVIAYNRPEGYDHYLLLAEWEIAHGLTIPSLELEVSREEQVGGSLLLTGWIANRGETNATQIEVILTFYNQRDAVLGLSETSVLAANVLAQGERVPFQLIANLPLSPVQRYTLDVVGRPTEKLPPSIEILNLEQEDFLGGVRLTGEIVNHSSSDQRLAVGAVFLDEQDQIVDIIQGWLDQPMAGIGPEESAPFEIYGYPPEFIRYEVLGW